MFIFAHRGTSAIEPENTILAIQAAVDINVDGIEIDVFEVDDKLIVIHDRCLTRTTSGTGLIFQSSFEELRQLNAGGGQKIPTLDEVLAIIPSGCILNIELKGINNINLLLKYIDQAITKYNLDSNQLLISSFNHQHLHLIKQQRPELIIGGLTASLPLDYAQFGTTLAAYSVHISIYALNKAFVEDAHQRGLKVYVYTVDEFVDIAMLSSIGVDGIFSNNPQQAREYFNKYQNSIN